MLRILITAALLCQLMAAQSQDLQYYFVDDTYQRSYTNPALNNEGSIMLASGLFGGIGSDGPTYKDLVTRNSEGSLILDLSGSIEEMSDVNNIFGSARVHTIDASVDLKVFRVSAGHAWKATGNFQFNKDLAEIATFGNAPYLDQVMSIGPAYQYINYNEVYLGFQKYVGPVSLGVRVKRLNGVQAIQTESRKIDITTDSEFYALRVDSDYEVNSAGALDYFELDSFNLDTKRFSVDNLFGANGGWAFDLGASVDLGDRLELSLGIIDIGSINWTKDAKTLTSNQDKTYDGVDLSRYIGTDDEIIVEDSVRALLDFTETEGKFSTTLPMQIYVGGRLKISDALTVGALLHTMKYDVKTRTSFALNATTKWKVLRLGVQYTARSEKLFNIGFNGALHIGPAIGFITVDNIAAIIDPYNSRSAAFRAGLTLRL